MKLPRHKTKIACTIGPASRSEAALKKLVKGGMSIARLNFSHGTFEEHRDDARRIRRVAEKLGRTVAVLVDLPGTKVRIGKLAEEPLTLESGDQVTLTTRQVAGTASLISVSYKRLPESVKRGSVIYLNDGFMQLKVREVEGSEVRCRVLVGGQLLSNKGLNLPKARFYLDPVTRRDLEIVDFCLKEGLDTFCVSFVEKARDLDKVRRFAKRRGASVKLVAKIEREEAVENIDELLEASDAIIIARGDLGVQMPLEEVPAVQKKLIRKANLRGRPVITATQMLESMTDNIRPTRAEVTDVANAILDGTDAVMLSEETAIGRYPVETARMMGRIAASIERERESLGASGELEKRFKANAGRRGLSIEDVVSLNALEAVRSLGARFILTPTETGSTPRRISRFRPDCWLLAFTPREDTHTFLSLSSGVASFLVAPGDDDWPARALKLIKSSGLVKKGDKVVVAEGSGASKGLGTDTLKIVLVE